MFDFIKKRFSKKPWAKYDIDLNGNTVLVDFNEAFNELKEEQEKEASIKEAKRLQEELESKKKVEPNLTIVHSGIEADGNIRLELDWNNEFIDLLRDNGFKGFDEEAMIQQYLISISNEAVDDGGVFIEGETSIIGEEIKPKKSRKKPK